MKKPLKRKIKYCAALLVALLALVTANAQKRMVQQQPIRSMTMAQNLESPPIPPKQKEAVSTYMLREARALVKMGYKVESYRNGEIIIVTIPADNLFNPNDIDLTSEGKKKIEPLLSYLKAENRFKIIVAVHTDDTGSAQYKENLAHRRLLAIEEFVDNNALFPQQMTGYALSDDEPLLPNSTRINRAANRRVEFYIVPCAALLSNLK